MKKNRSNHQWNYQQRYEALFDNLLGAYADYFSLLKIQESNSAVTTNPVASLQKRYREKALLLLVRALQGDLCLSITRMYTDQKSDSNTFSNLGQYIYNTYQRKGTYKLPKQYSRKASEIKDIVLFRDYFLAHTLVEDKEFNIQLSYIEGLLDELRNWLNSLCYTDIGSEITPLKDSDLEDIKKNVNLGLSVLMSLPNNASFVYEDR